MPPTSSPRIPAGCAVDKQERGKAGQPGTGSRGDDVPGRTAVPRTSSRTRSSRGGRGRAPPDRQRQEQLRAPVGHTACTLARAAALFGHIDRSVQWLPGTPPNRG
jgi:hypothetical protein